MSTVGDISDKVFENKLAAECLTAMGQTSENVAEKFKVSREEQDKVAVASNERAVSAAKGGRFKAEIVPVTVKFTGADGVEKQITVTQDDGPRAGTTLQALAKLPAAFKKNGTTTAGNSSQVSDGAAAVLLMTRKKAEELKLPILGKFRAYAVVGVEPGIMGIGPAVAIPAVMKKAGLKVQDIDLWEINEAFASQAAYCVNKLGIDMEKVNVNGGAIALGHPLGMTGARQVATLFSELKRSNKKLGVTSMCIGTGMGAAAVFEAE
jgi:acetyl-CoA acyltransferase 1